MKAPAGNNLMRGPQVQTFETFLKLLDQGYWFYFWERAYHPLLVANMSLGVLRSSIERGQVHLAVNSRKL